MQFVKVVLPCLPLGLSILVAIWSWQGCIFYRRDFFLLFSPLPFCAFKYSTPPTRFIIIIIITISQFDFVPLHVCALQGFTKTCRVLLLYGAEVSATNKVTFPSIPLKIKTHISAIFGKAVDT